VNGAEGTSDIEGKAAKGSGKRTGKRASFKLLSLFRREGGDDLLEARIAAQRVPEGQHLEHAVAGDKGRRQLEIAVRKRARFLSESAGRLLAIC